MFNKEKQQKLNLLEEADYQSLKRDISRISQLLPELLEVDYRLFELDQTYESEWAKADDDRASDQDCDDLEPAILACRFLYAIQIMQFLNHLYPFRRFPLYLEIMADAMDEYELWDFPVERHRFSQANIDDLNDCIRFIQDDLGEADTRRELKRMQRQQRNQKKSIREYIEQLFSCYARLEVIRLDLGYQQDIEVSYAELMRHREQLTRYLREKHDGNAHVGFIWKLEYGLRKGYHFHMMIFMDGSKVQQSILHGKLIGNHWNKAITNGLGTAYNCNAKMDDYRDCGIGTVNYYSKAKINSLFKASDYLTKPDPYVEIMQQIQSEQAWRNGNVSLSRQILNGREFGKGELPRLGNRRGRKRGYLNR